MPVDKFYTYIHKRADDGQIFYIGKGHGKRAWSKNHSNWWKRVVNKHGYVVEFFKETLSENEAFNHETEMIAYGRKLGWPLVNITDGGDGVSGLNHSKRTKSLISKKMKKISQTPNFKKLVSERMKRFSQTSRGKQHMKLMAILAGRKNRESGYASYRGKIQGKKNVEMGRMSIIGKIGGMISGQKNVESGHIQRLGRLAKESGELLKRASAGGKISGPIQGKKNVESGQIQKLGRIYGKIYVQQLNAKRWGIEIEPGKWVSKKTGKVLLDVKKEVGQNG